MRLRDPHASVQEVPHLSRRGSLLHESRDVREHAVEIELLLIAGAPNGRFSLAAYRQHGRVIQLGIVQAGDAVGGARTAGRQTDAKFTGELGVCLSTGGPGATHRITGLYDAKLDHAPVLAICGQAEATVRGASYQQELNLDRMFADVAGFVQEASSPAQVRHLLDRCVRIAKAHNTPSVIILPKDVQDEAYEEPAVAHGFTRSGVGYSRPKIVPEDTDLRRAAEILNAGKKVAILVGAGARGAAPLLIEMATLLGAGVAKALLGKDVLPDDLPFVTGAIGLLGTEPSWDLMQDCDTLLMIGTGFPWSEFLPKDGAARAVQIDIEASMLSLRYPVDVNLHGDAAATLKALLPLIRRKDDREWSKTIETNVSAWWKKLEGRAMADANPVNPQRVVWEMSPLLPANASSPATADPARTGMPATSGCSRASVRRSRAAWRRWGRPFPTRSEPSSLIRTGRSSPSSATAPCR